MPGGNASITEGLNAFVNIGCAHVPHAAAPHRQRDRRGAAEQERANLFSDLALHNMGPGLADDIAQGAATRRRVPHGAAVGTRPSACSSCMTGGLNLLTAIQAHRSNGNGRYPASEANAVIDRFNALSTTARQNMLNFLRSL